MEEKKKISALQINGIIFLIMAFLAFIYLAGGKLMKNYDYYFRTWVIVAGEAVTFLAAPGALIALPITGTIAAARRKKKTSARLIAGGVSIIMTGIFFLYLYVGFIFYLLLRLGGIERDTTIKHYLIEGVYTRHSDVSDGFCYHYYTPVSVFLKKRYYSISPVMEQKAYEKYGEEFSVDEEDLIREQTEELAYYRLHPDENPEITMVMANGGGIQGFQDDYPAARAGAIAEGNEELKKYIIQEKKDWELSGEDSYDFSGQIIQVQVDSAEKAKEVSDAAAGAIKEILEDDFFLKEGNYSYLELVCLFQDGSSRQAQIPFGNRKYEEVLTLFNYKWVEADYYTNPTHIYEIIEEVYQQAEEGIGESNKEEEAEAPELSEPDVSTPETVEGAYLRLYEEVFEPLGDGYDTGYNAKGNFYATLSEGRGRVNEEAPEMDTVRTVVYDRISKNGKCHIFVYYETYYKEEGSEYTTAIRNTYAVDKITGAVTESGKHAWADTGSTAYREAAGEP